MSLPLRDTIGTEQHPAHETYMRVEVSPTRQDAAQDYKGKKMESSGMTDTNETISSGRTANEK